MHGSAVSRKGNLMASGGCEGGEGVADPLKKKILKEDKVDGYDRSVKNQGLSGEADADAEEGMGCICTMALRKAARTGSFSVFPRHISGAPHPRHRARSVALGAGDDARPPPPLFENFTCGFLGSFKLPVKWILQKMLQILPGPTYRHNRHRYVPFMNDAVIMGLSASIHSDTIMTRQPGGRYIVGMRTLSANIFFMPTVSERQTLMQGLSLQAEQDTDDYFEEQHFNALEEDLDLDHRMTSIDSASDTSGGY
ncbi:hypothetical protein B0H11DRAFT_1909444 [Mycena galericulata]|nr:hypothetical protein B0H11DRAFT_1909444 [Mycena galericulata]